MKHGINPDGAGMIKFVSERCLIQIRTYVDLRSKERRNDENECDVFMQ